MGGTINEWRRLVDRIHDQIGNRANFFLVVNGLLVAGATTSDHGWISIILSVFGILVCAMWLQLGRRSIDRYRKLWDKLLKEEQSLQTEERVYTYLMEDLPQPEFKFLYSADFLAYYFSLAFLVLWIILLFIFSGMQISGWLGLIFNLFGSVMLFWNPHIRSHRSLERGGGKATDPASEQFQIEKALRWIPSRKSRAFLGKYFYKIAFGFIATGIFLQLAN